MKFKADKILRGCRVYTCDPLLKWSESVALAGDRILQVGSEKEIMPLAEDDTEIIDLRGKLLLPLLLISTPTSLSALWP